MEKDPRVTKAASIAADWWVSLLKGGSPDIFRKRLVELVEEKLSKLEEWDELSVLCDYDPDVILTEALTAAAPADMELRCYLKSALPWKHETFISRTRVTPKAGYGNFLPDILVEP